LRSWTQNWYNTDVSFQQKKQSAQANASSVQSLNNQVMRNNIESYWRQKWSEVFNPGLVITQAALDKAANSATAATKQAFRQRVSDIGSFSASARKQGLNRPIQYTFNHPPSIRN